MLHSQYIISFQIDSESFFLIQSFIKQAMFNSVHIFDIKREYINRQKNIILWRWYVPSIFVKLFEKNTEMQPTL